MVKSPTIPTPHDALFRALVSAPKSAAAVLRDHLPNDVTALLSSKPPKLLEGTFVDEALRGSQADALFEVELKSGGTAFVYTLLEHKSSAEADTPLQLAGYMLRIWAAHAQKTVGKLKSLPPIVPMIIYHGASKWAYPTGIADMIAGDEPALKYLPGSDFILRDIRQMPREDLSSDGPARATFMAMRGEADAYLEAMLDDLDADHTLQQQVLHYILELDPSFDWPRLAKRLLAAQRHQLEDDMGSILQTARAEARAEGETLGKLETKADTLRKQMTRRFGLLDASVVARINAAKESELDLWLDRILDAPSLESVLDGLH